MMERMAFAVQMSLGFEGGERAVHLDEWFIEDCGWIDSDVWVQFVKARYPKAIRVMRLSPHQMHMLEKKYEIKFEPEAGCHPLK